MTDSAELRDWLDDRGIKLKAVAKKLGITCYSLQKKIDNITEFKATEIAAFSELGMDRDTRDRIFFGSV